MLLFLLILISPRVWSCSRQGPYDTSVKKISKHKSLKRLQNQHANFAPIHCTLNHDGDSTLRIPVTTELNGCPRHPTLTALFSSCRLKKDFQGVSPFCINMWSSSFPAAFPPPPELLSFPKNPTSPEVCKVGQLQFCHFCLQRCVRLNLLRDPLVHLSDGPGYPYSSPPTPSFR